MDRCWSLDEVVRDSGACVTVGTFDGIHRGHTAILSYLVERARARSGRSVLVTFDPHPRTVVYGESVPLLTTPGERADVCAAVGLDRFIVLPFNRSLAEMEPDRFVSEILVGRVGLKEVVIGHDHGFGRDRSGDHALLERLGRTHGFEVDIIPAKVIQSHVVSSSIVRDVLTSSGNVTKAEELLGRRYDMSGTVISGARRGRTLGYPTANIKLADSRKLIPADGVYAVFVQSQQSETVHAAMMNIGRRPTFEESVVQLEVHLLDFDGDLYGQRLRIEFVDRLRAERRFPSVEALVAQLREDEARCRARLRVVS